MPIQFPDDPDQFLEIRIFIEEVVGSRLYALFLIPGIGIKGEYANCGRITFEPDFLYDVDPPRLGD